MKYILLKLDDKNIKPNSEIKGSVTVNYPGKYDVKELGLNYRMSEIHASIGVEQIKKIKKFLKIRKRNFDFLIKKLKDIRNIKILKNKNKDFSSSNYCMSLILDKKISMKRSKIIRFLNNNGIGKEMIEDLFKRSPRVYSRIIKNLGY